ncbi:hypothetical protein EU805_10665 [Salipiger sp. IMCC34102]|uniref:hypothetical protein n=1 Tax=Salipiger sp. IMCC34102 TaxID=2510647 RepID=UPI00101C7CEC|nr:hypothetical protein [Salipiger sp. IMCC34102]RYH02304.1 hypothetical protein EU805_10665 [Salipiger sp. IMCC34102]
MKDFRAKRAEKITLFGNSVFYLRFEDERRIKFDELLSKLDKLYNEDIYQRLFLLRNEITGHSAYLLSSDREKRSKDGWIEPTQSEIIQAVGALTSSVRALHHILFPLLGLDLLPDREKRYSEVEKFISEFPYHPK